jgi:energy-coupling factor transporter ATP-binding protein EcfA2
MNSPFVIHDPVTPPIFAGREKEIKLLETAILGSGESVALFGNDAIGKSSIIKSFCQMVEPKDRKILMINLNVFDFKTAIETDTFLSYVTHQICTAIWMELMGKTFSNLLEDAVLLDKGSLTDTEFERAVKRIYRIVTSVKISGVGKATNEIGAEFFIKGKTVSEYQYTSEHKPLATFEFLNLLDELISIIKEYGYHSILLFRIK